MGEIIYNFYPLNVIIDDLSAFNALKMIFQWKLSTWCGGTANAMQLSLKHSAKSILSSPTSSIISRRCLSRTFNV